MGFRGYAVEPNDAMREEGMRQGKTTERFRWSAGSAERTGLPEKCVDWVLMASSFHWTQPQLALAEFHRILRPGVSLRCCGTRATWKAATCTCVLKRESSRSFQPDPSLLRFQQVHAGRRQDPGQYGHFENVIFMEAPHLEVMDKDRYLGAWRSVNDIQAQAGPERFARILQAIEDEIRTLDAVPVPYKTRAWTVQAK